MRHKLLAGIAFPLALLAACQNGPIRSTYRLVFPELPKHWSEFFAGMSSENSMGIFSKNSHEPHWRIEWVAEGGIWRERELAPGGGTPGIPLIQEWTTAVLAWPFWPDFDLLPGMMRPLGALFPWDASGGNLLLSWEGGVEAVFWKEMAAADRTTSAANGRLPWYFDWPRFRELLESGNIPEAVRRDLWLADWKSIAQKTVQSGFDRRRIASRTFSTLVIPGIGGHWIGSSPFAPPLDAAPDGSLRPSVTATPDAWISPMGILKCSVSGWVFIACEDTTGQNTLR